MEAWTLQLTVGELLLDFSIVGGLLIAGAFLRRRVGFLKRYVVPSSLIAGFLGLLLGGELARLLPLDAARMGAYVYHLLALTFIGVGLYRADRRHTFGVVNLGFMQVTVMLIQGAVGLGLALLIVRFLLPDMNPATGMLLPLGFAMGPGIAYSIGQSWNVFGFVGADSIGLTVAAIGFVIAYFGGMTLVNRLRSEANFAALEQDHAESRPTHERIPTGSRDRLTIESIEPLAMMTALIGGLYYVTVLFAGGLEWVLVAVGLEQEVPVLWSFHFILGNLIALFTRHVVLPRTGADWMDDALLGRMTGTIAEYLIATSIMAISLTVAWHYALPVLLICGLGAVLTYFFLRFTTLVVFRRFRLERFIGMFAQMTGTISSGLALIRVTDPDLRTPVAQELVLSSGMALAIGFPLLIVINMPFTVFGGTTGGFLVVLGIMVAYLLVLLAGWAFYFRRYAERI